MRITRFAALVVGATGLVLMGAAVPSAASPPRNTFEIVKLCPSAGDDASCDIVASTPFTELVGGRIIYDDRVYWENPAGWTFEIARVTLTTPGDAGTVVRGQVRWIRDSGLITLRQGSGTLAGLHGTGVVEYTGDVGAQSKFTLTGTWHIDPRK